MAEKASTSSSDDQEMRIKKIHAKMIINVAGYIYPKLPNDGWTKFLTLLEPVLDPADLWREDNSFIDICKTLKSKGIIDYGSYTELYKAVSEVDVTAAEIIKAASDDIQTIRSVDDDPGVSRAKPNISSHSSMTEREQTQQTPEEISEVKVSKEKLKTDTGNIKGVMMKAIFFVSLVLVTYGVLTVLSNYEIGSSLPDLTSNINGWPLIACTVAVMIFGWLWSRFIVNVEPGVSRAKTNITSHSSVTKCEQTQQTSAEEPEISMHQLIYETKEGSAAAFIVCKVHPQPDSIVWKRDKSPPPRKRVLIDNHKYFSGKEAPSLVIRNPNKPVDEGHYQCMAVGNGKPVNGVIVRLQVQKQSYNTVASVDQGSQMSSEIADLNSQKSKRVNCAKKPMPKGTPFVDKGSQMSFRIKEEIDAYRQKTTKDISNGFSRATRTKKRVATTKLKTGSVIIFIDISPASDSSEPSSLHLAEEFKHYLLDGGTIQLTDDSHTELRVDEEANFKITPENAAENGFPYVNISHGEFTVPVGKATVIQSYVIASPEATSIEWYKIKDDNHIPIEIDTGRYFAGSIISPTLIIRETNMDDQGWYQCSATNSKGTGWSNISFLLIIQPGTVDDVSEDISGWSDDISGGSEDIPGGSDDIPGGSENIPGGSDDVPGGSDDIPGGSDDISGGSENIPGGSDDIPGGSDDIPGGSEDISGGEDISERPRDAKLKEPLRSDTHSGYVLSPEVVAANLRKNRYSFGSFVSSSLNKEARTTTT